MIRSLNSDKENGMIDCIKHAMDEQNVDKVDRLIIAHSDSIMIDQLDGHADSNCTVVVALPQSVWSMDSDMESEMLTWAVTELQASSICLVGHSNGGTPEGLVQIFKSQNSKDRETRVQNPSSLFERVKRGQARSCACEDHFKRQLKHIVQLVQQFSPENQTKVGGYFYRAESGVFCTLDENEWNLMFQTNGHVRREFLLSEMTN